MGWDELGFWERGREKEKEMGWYFPNPCLVFLWLVGWLGDWFLVVKEPAVRVGILVVIRSGVTKDC
tara:strand:- start:410 stop:607 length:198 start_codon:yes stop_codon:yes gene_type:complete